MNANTQEERVQILKNTLVFSRFDEKDLQSLTSVFKPRDLEDGELLFREGESGDFMAVIIDGHLSIEVTNAEGESVQAALLEPGDVVGEMACMDPAPRSASVRAQGDTTVWVLHRVMLDTLRQNAPNLFVPIVTGVALSVTERIRATNERLTARSDASATPDAQPQSAPGQPYAGDINLAHVPALSSVPENELAVLKTVARPLEFSPGELLCAEGEPASSCFIVFGGEVEVFREVNRQHLRLAEIRGGGLFGQMALLDDGTRSASVKATTTTLVLEFGRDRFQALLANASPLAITFQELVVRTGIRQLRLADEKLAELASVSHLLDDDDELTFVQHDQEPDVPDSDLDDLAAAYLESALRDGGFSAGDLDQIRILTPEGTLTPAEIKARQGR